MCNVGHSLEEIRVRSLQNIISKLDHGVLCDSDLIQEKHLHIRLLEWFNFPSCVMQDKVLALILRLSKVSLLGLERYWHWVIVYLAIFADIG